MSKGNSVSGAHSRVEIRSQLVKVEWTGDPLEVSLWNDEIGPLWQEELLDKTCP